MRSIAFFVFIFPIIISLFLGTFVMAEVLKEPDRSLQMWNFKFSEGGEIFQTKELKIIGLLSKYSTSNPIEIEVSIQDSTFDCGDLYITIFELISPKLEGIEIYQRLKPIGRDLYKEIVRYLVFM